MNQCESTWMVSVSAFHCVKTHIHNIRTTKPTLDAIQMSFQSWFTCKKNLESQWINVSQPKWLLRVQSNVNCFVWIPRGPQDQHLMNSKWWPLAFKLLLRAMVFRCLNIFNHHQYQLKWVNQNGFCEYITLREDLYAQQEDQETSSRCNPNVCHWH